MEASLKSLKNCSKVTITILIPSLQVGLGVLEASGEHHAIAPVTLSNQIHDYQDGGGEVEDEDDDQTNSTNSNFGFKFNTFVNSKESERQLIGRGQYWGQCRQSPGLAMQMLRERKGRMGNLETLLGE